MMWLWHDFPFNQKGSLFISPNRLGGERRRVQGREADRIESLPFDTNKQIYSPINAGDI